MLRHYPKSNGAAVEQIGLLHHWKIPTHGGGANQRAITPLMQWRSGGALALARIHPNPLAQRQRSAGASLASRRYQPGQRTVVDHHQHQCSSTTTDRPKRRRDQRRNVQAEEGGIELVPGAVKLTAELCAPSSGPCIKTANSAVGARGLHNAVTLGWPNLLAVPVSSVSAVASHTLPYRLHTGTGAPQALVQACKWRTGADVSKTDASRDTLKYARSETRQSREGCASARGRYLLGRAQKSQIEGGGVETVTSFYNRHPVSVSRGSQNFFSDLWNFGGGRFENSCTTSFNIVCGV